MFELRWIIPEGTSTLPATLQYRTALAVDASGAFCPGAFSGWKAVPTEVIPTKRVDDLPDDYEV